MFLKGQTKEAMTAALNPNKMDFSMSLGLSTHVCLCIGLKGQSFLVGLFILNCPCSALVALLVSIVAEWRVLQL